MESDWRRYLLTFDLHMYAEMSQGAGGGALADEVYRVKACFRLRGPGAGLYVFLTPTMTKSLWLWLHCEEWRQRGHLVFTGTDGSYHGLGELVDLGLGFRDTRMAMAWGASCLGLCYSAMVRVASRTIQMRFHRPSPPPRKGEMNGITRKGEGFPSSHP